MFILLEGQMKVRTHWVLDEGMNLIQKQYLDYIYEQNGSGTKAQEIKEGRFAHNLEPSDTDSQDS